MTPFEAPRPATPTLPEEPLFRTPGSLAYVQAVAAAPLNVIALWLTNVCTECDLQPTAEGTESDHGMIGDFVLIGCEGYYVVNPNVVGIRNPNWCDWLK